ncbi:MAG: serine protease, partial [bacterium]
MFFDASVFPGSSGGPLIRKSDGVVVGIITLIVSTGDGYGLNAGLNASYLQDFFNQVIRK